MLLDITISYDRVEVENVVIPKPNYVSTLEWMDFWVNARDYNADEIEFMREELQRVRDENENLRAEIEGLETVGD